MAKHTNSPKTDEKTTAVDLSTFRQRWLAAARPQLERIVGENATKKQATVLAVITAEVTGYSVDWTRKDICSKSTWFGDWQHDPILTDVLKQMRTAVRETRLAETARALDEALTVLQLSAVSAAQALAQLVKSSNEKVRRLAAVNLLDRASVMTAEKPATSDVNLPGLQDALNKIYGSD